MNNTGQGNKVFSHVSTNSREEVGMPSTMASSDKILKKPKAIVTGPTITNFSSDKVTSILRRNDRFLSLLNKEEVELLEEDRIIEKTEVKTVINTHLWTEAKLIDIMADRLSRCEVIITGKVRIDDKQQDKVYEFEGCCRLPKYSEEVIYIAQNAAFCESARVLTIHLSDLGEKILNAIQALDAKSQRHVIIAVGKRLFKMYYPYYFNRIGDLIRVRTEV